MATSVAGLALAVLAPLAAQGSRASLPPGFPSTWRAVDDALVGLEQTSTLRLIHGVWQLRADGSGVKAYLYVSWREALVRKSPAAVCGGLRYTGRYVTETRGNAGEGWFGLTGEQDGTIHLAVTRRIAIYKGAAPGPPICVEARGTWSGASGVGIGFNGTFTLRDEGTIVFR